MKRNHYRLAVGLSYDDSQDEAPHVQVRGEGWLADEVVRLAGRFGVPVIERSEVARALEHLELDEEIPEELYEAIAIILKELEES